MIEFIPFILITLGWHPDHPGQFDIERRVALFETEADCKAAGDEFVAGREMYGVEFGGAQFAYKCVQAPAPEEYERLFREIESRREDDRGEK